MCAPGGQKAQSPYHKFASKLDKSAPNFKIPDYPKIAPLTFMLLEIPTRGDTPCCRLPAVIRFW